jgi:hypothetical protein
VSGSELEEESHFAGVTRSTAIFFFVFFLVAVINVVQE